MRIFCIIISLLLCLSLFSCSRTEKDTGEILASLMEDCGPFPAGVIYTPSAEEGEEGYLSPALMEALWGEDAEEGFSMLQDYSIYLSSFAAPYEISVFSCFSATDAMRIEELCRARADIVSVALRHTEYYGLCQSIRICRKGRNVIFLMTDHPDKAEKSAKSLIS